MRRVVFFAPNGKQPELRWLPIVDNPDHKTVAAEKLGLDEDVVTLEIPMNVRNQMPLARRVYLLYTTGTKSDKCNTALTAATNGRLKTAWSGPMAAFVGDFEPTSGRVLQIHDFDMCHYSSLITFMTALTDYSPEELWSLYLQALGTTVQAVRFSCQRNRKAGKPAIQLTKIAHDHPVFWLEVDKPNQDPDEGLRGGEISQISERIGLPLLAWKPEDGLQQPAQSHGLRDEEIAYMMLPMKREVRFLGSPATPWLGSQVSDVVLARHDRQPLDTDVVAAFAAYCCFHVLAFVNWACQSNRGTWEQRVQRVLDEESPAKWATYKSQWHALKTGLSTASDYVICGMPRMGLTPQDALEVVARYMCAELM